jgi:hypothetical protein
VKPFNHTRPRRNGAGDVIGENPAPVSRVTVAALGGQFGPDKRRRLVVTLKAGDIIEFRPERTRQIVTMAAVDLYRIALQRRAACVALEKARQTKQRKADARAARRIAYTDRKLTNQAKKDC